MIILRYLRVFSFTADFIKFSKFFSYTTTRFTSFNTRWSKTVSIISLSRKELALQANSGGSREL